MSDRYLNMVKCPHCGKSQKFEMWRVINVADNPEMKEKVKTKEVFKLECKKCGRLVNADHQFLYEDPESKIAIHYAREKDVPAVKEDLKKYEGYTTRVVSYQNDLIEKLMIFDAGLDDRIIEIVKAIYVNQLYTINPSYKIDEILFDNTKEEAKIIFISGGGLLTESAMSNEVYKSIESQFKDKMAPFAEETEVSIDFEWAIKLLEAQNTND